MQMEARTILEVEQELDRMKVRAKTSLYPQVHQIMGHTIVCDWEHGKRMIWEFDCMRIARKHLAGLIVANAK